MPEGTERNLEEPHASVPTDRQTQRLRELENGLQDLSGNMLEETTKASFRIRESAWYSQGKSGKLSFSTANTWTTAKQVAPIQ
jgi:hypothetical protein